MTTKNASHQTVTLLETSIEHKRVIGYLISPFIKYMGIDNPLLDILVFPATIGEFWMIGYLLIYGIRPCNK